MTTFWTVMVITFANGPFEGYATFIPYRDAMSCGQHISETLDMYELDIGLRVEMIQCEKTNILSSTIRPKKRP